MRSASSSLRRLRRNALILLALVTLAATGGALASWGVSETYEGELIISWVWAVPVILAGAALLGALRFWRGRRLALGAVCSCALLVLLAAAWAGSYWSHAAMAVCARCEGATHAYLPGWQVDSVGGCVLANAWWDLRPPEFLRDVFGTDKPALQITGRWSPRGAGIPAFSGKTLLDWPWLRQCGFVAAWFRQVPSPGASFTVYQLRVPYWFLLPWLLICPALYARATWKRAHAPATPRCPTCGYDLRAHTPPSALSPDSSLPTTPPPLPQRPHRRAAPNAARPSPPPPDPPRGRRHWGFWIPGEKPGDPPPPAPAARLARAAGRFQHGGTEKRRKGEMGAEGVTRRQGEARGRERGMRRGAPRYRGRQGAMGRPRSATRSAPAPHQGQTLPRRTRPDAAAPFRPGPM